MFRPDHSRRSSVTRGAFAVAALLAVTSACKDKDENADGDAKAADGSDAAKAAELAKEAAKKALPPASAMAPASQLQRGNVLGHFMFAHPSAFLKEIKAQLSTPQFAGFLEESTLRSLASMQLGPRSGIAQNVDLERPLGCALVDIKDTDVPVACVTGYKGGAAALVKDLGDQDKQADAGGHTAHYRVQNQDVFIDALGDDVILSNHAEAFAKGKDYIADNMIARASKVVTDIEAVAYVSGLMDRYKDKIDPLLNLATNMPMPPATGSTASQKFANAFADYNRKSTERSVQTVREIEQFNVGLGLEADGFVARYAMFATEGSKLQKDSQAAGGGAFDHGMVTTLPAQSWLAAGFAFDREKMFQTENAIETRKIMAKGYAEAMGKDTAAVDKALEGFLTENAALYGNDMAYSVMHQPKTLGGAMVVQSLKGGQSGRDSWKAWSQAFAPTAILPAEVTDKVTWSFQPDATTIDGVPVDRWTIEPTDKGKDEIRKDGGAEAKKWEERLGGFKLVIDRVEVDGKVLFVLAPGSSEAYVKSAIGAVKGNGSLAGNKGLEKVLGRIGGASMLVALDVKGGANWLRDIIPPDKSKDIPPELGLDLSDVFLSASYSQKGAQAGEFVISQPFIDQIRDLVNKKQMQQQQ